MLNQTTLPVSVTNNDVYGETTIVSGGTSKQSGSTIAAHAPTALPLPSGYTMTGSAVFANLLSFFHLLA